MAKSENSKLMPKYGINQYYRNICYGSGYFDILDLDSQPSSDSIDVRVWLIQTSSNAPDGRTLEHNPCTVASALMCLTIYLGDLCFLGVIRWNSVMVCMLFGWTVLSNN